MTLRFGNLFIFRMFLTGTLRIRRNDFSSGGMMSLAAMTSGIMRQANEFCRQKEYDFYALFLVLYVLAMMFCGCGRSESTGAAQGDAIAEE